MKRLILAALLLSTPAFAQQAPTAEEYIGGLQVAVSDSLTKIKATLVQRDQQISALTKQAEVDKQTIVDLTAKITPAKPETDTK
jgi:hypothetical protein